MVAMTMLSPAEVLDYLVDTNEEMYNYSKLSEELFELGEIVMKKMNKNGTEKEPSFEKFVEEMGDVELRITILKRKLGIEKDVQDRIDGKLGGKFADYINSGKYIGRI